MTLKEYLKTRDGANNGDSLFSDSLCVKDVDGEERTVTAFISTDRIDRMKEVLLPKGAKIVEFLRNPVVPWAHNSFAPPVGKAKWLKKTKNSLIAKVQFATTERAEEIWQLFRQGFLKAFSVGFKPIDGHAPTEKEIKKNPAWAGAEWIFTEWELLEFSPVTIPANPDALAIAIKANDITLSKELRDELKVIEDDIGETFYPDGEKPEAEKTKTEEVGEKADGNKENGESIEDVRKLEITDTKVRATPLPMIVNPNPNPEVVVEAKPIVDALPIKVDHNYDVKTFVEDVKPAADVEIIYEPETFVSVELSYEETLKKVHEEFVKDLQGVMWEIV